jgi:DNA-binding CsgD family transcriptional regulator
MTSDIPFVRVRLSAMDAALKRRSDEHYIWFMKKYGLTPMQARITVFIAQGGSVAEYAHAADIAPATVRSHLKAIFKKTGTTRQAELVTLLMRRGTAM